jgi:hypothetical protein
MGYTRNGDRVTIEMNIEDWQSLVFVLGAAAGAASRNGDTASFLKWLELANRLNAGNPNWLPYELAAPERVQ